MKRFLKLISLATILVALVLLPIGAHAAEHDDAADKSIEDSLSADAEAESTESASNPFDEMYQTISQHSGELLSLCSFVGTLIIALLYKKGLAPLLSGSADKLSSAIEGLRRDADTEILERGKMIASRDEHAALLESRLECLTNKLDEMQRRISSEAELVSCTEKVRIVMQSQIDILYDVFMSSSLPQYQKELIGERMLRMKKELTGCEE